MRAVQQQKARIYLDQQYVVEEDVSLAIGARDEMSENTESTRGGSEPRHSQPTTICSFARYPHPSSTALWSNRRRASAAPVLSATSFLIASERSIGAMPQLVQGKSRSTGTKRDACSIVAATSSGVSTRSLATSIAPSKTSLPFKRPSRSSGTLAPAHSTET